jgi:C-terminal processing protease CtpA/Prc
MLKLTIAYWLTPKGEKIEGNGLKPDIEVKDTLIESTSTDAVLDKAIEVIKTL